MKMTRGLALLGLVGLSALTAACGHPEKSVVDSYFNAINADDKQTLTSFAATDFSKYGKRVKAWKIKDTLEETRAAAPITELVKKADEAAKAQDANNREGKKFGLDNVVELDAVKEARKKNEPVPAKYEALAKTWDEYNEKDRGLKKVVADAKAEVEKEKRNITRSMGQQDNAEALSGDMITKKILVTVTHEDGQAKDYVMTLRKYEMKGEGDKKLMSRWMVYDVQPS